MSSASNARIQFQCPSCQQLLQLPPEMSGKTCRCAACGGTMTVPNQPGTSGAIGPAGPPSRPPVGSGAGSPSAPTQPTDSPFPQINTGGGQSDSPFPKIDTGPQQSISEIVRERSEAEARGDFAPERQAMSMGVVGGLLMMGIAVVWFVLGLMGGWIYFYPPILFIAGLVALFKGIIDGNVAGERRRRRRH